MNFQNQKDVHVKSYSREGETVKEHWRSKPGQGGFVSDDCNYDDLNDPRNIIFNPQSKDNEPRMEVLEGGVEVTVGLGKMILDVLKQIAQGAGEVAGVAAPYALMAVRELLKNRNIANAISMPAYGAQIPTVPINVQKPNFVRREPVHRAPMGIRAQTPNILDLPYKNYLDKQNILPKNTVNIHNENKNKFYQNLSDLPKDLSTYFNKNTTNQMQKELRFKHYQPIIDERPKLAKNILGMGATLAKTNLFNLKPASEMLSAQLDFNKYAPKIHDTYIANNYKDLGHLADFIRDKLISQNMDIENTPGIVYGFESKISKDIAVSNEVKKFRRKYSLALKNGQIVTTTINLSSTKNLNFSINNADVLLAYYDSNMNLIMVLLDTSDYNSTDKSSLVRNGYSAQERGLLNQYFSLFFVFIPLTNFQY